jgi:hypothetical protein
MLKFYHYVSGETQGLGRIYRQAVDYMLLLGSKENVLVFVARRTMGMLAASDQGGPPGSLRFEARETIIST